MTDMAKEYKTYSKVVSLSELDLELNILEARDGIVQDIIPSYYSVHPIYKSLELSSVLIIYKIPKTT